MTISKSKSPKKQISTNNFQHGKYVISTAGRNLITVYGTLKKN